MLARYRGVADESALTDGGRLLLDFAVKRPASRVKPAPVVTFMQADLQLA
jgi:hypothetical protein